MIWWIIATLVAFFVKGVCGFANSMIFSTILSFENNNINISPVELVMGYPTNIILVWKEKKSINWKMCLPLAVMVVLGDIPGILFLRNMDTGIIKIIFGFVIVFIGIEMLLRDLNLIPLKESGVLLWVIGILSGVLCGLYGVGVLLGAYVSRIAKDSHVFKANMCMVFFIENTVRVVLYSILGIITLNIVKQAIILWPLMLVGLLFGMAFSRLLDERITKKIVTIMLIISGIALIINSL